MMSVETLKKQRINDNEELNQYFFKAKTLSEALPYMRQFSGCRFVVKYGGNAMGDESLTESFAKDVVLMKQVGLHPIVVHGGGPQISQMLNRLKIKTEFVNGLRITDQSVVEVVEMVLVGTINKQIVSAINSAGAVAVGISGKDGELIKARKLKRLVNKTDSNIEKVLDLGFVGEPESINPYILDKFYESNIIPVIAPIGIGSNGETYNINADTVAGAVAESIQAKRLFLLTDVQGIKDKNGQIIPEINCDKAHELIKDKTITGGMIPKIETCISAVENGVEGAVILDGRSPHSLLLEIFTESGHGSLVS